MAGFPKLKLPQSPVTDDGYASVGSSPVLDRYDESNTSADVDTSLLSVGSDGIPTRNDGVASKLAAEYQRSSALTSLYVPTPSGVQATLSPETFWDWLCNWTPFWLFLYFWFNLSLTIYNKIALGSFPYPWTLTSIHSLCATCGSLAAYKLGYFEFGPARSMRENLILLGFSSLYTVNIAVSNVSLNLVSVPVHQVVRATVPLFAMFLMVMIYRKRYAPETYLALGLIIFGVTLATYGDYSASSYGLFLTLFGSVLAALKGIATNALLVGSLKLHPLDLLLKMSPLAFIQCSILAIITGESSAIYDKAFVVQSISRNQWLSLILNGAIAFGLNVVSFTGNKKTSAVTMSVCGNIKQVLTVLLSVLIFNLSINRLNMFGISVTMAGGAYYSYVEYQSKHKSGPQSSLPQYAAVPSSPALSSLKRDEDDYKPRSPNPAAAAAAEAPLWQYSLKSPDLREKEVASF